MTDRYRQALEGLRERCAQEVERITARRRVVAAMANNEAVKPCEVAAAIRKIDVQQHYECAVREIKALRAEVDALAKDAAKYRWGINNARWIRSEQEAYVAIPVAPDADLSCVAVRDAAIDAAMQRTTAREGER